MKYILVKNQNEGNIKTKKLEQTIKIGTIAVSLSLLMIIMSISDVKSQINTEEFINDKKRIENIVSKKVTVGEKQYIENTVSYEEICNINYKMNIYTDFEISDELRDKIEKTISNYPNKNGFYVETVDGNLKFGYNEDVVIFGASSVKAPYALYCYKEIDKGNGNFTDTKTYESRFTKAGTGNMKNTAVIGEDYNLEYLLYESIYSSDNIAYIMLQDRYGKEGYNKMLDNLGCSTSKLSPYRNWIDATPKELVIVWREIYNYTINDKQGKFYNSLDISRSNILDECVEVNTIHKGGWTDDAYNESGIVYGDNPYIITVMTNSGGNKVDQKYVRDIIKLCDEVINEYTLSINENNTKQLTK